jgi:diguanylate cyclase (GGDEF)-like protein/PAS domain S-box-containing protein
MTLPARACEHLPRAAADDPLQRLLDLETERDALLEELRAVQAREGAGERRWRTLLDSLPLGVLTIDPDGAIRRMNPVAQAWFESAGRAPATLPWLFGAAHAPAVQQALAKAQTDGQSHLTLQRLSLPDPAPLQLELRLLCLGPSTADRGPLLVLCIDLEAGERRRDDGPLLRALLDSTADLVYATDPEGRLLTANRAVSRLLGLPLAGLVGRRRDELMPMTDALAHDQHDRHVIDQGHSVMLREELHGGVAPVGRTFQTLKFPIRDGRGQLLGVGGVSRDVSAEVEQESQRQLSERVFLQSSDAIIAVDAQGVVRRANPAFERLSGVTAEVAQGRALLAVQPHLHTQPETPHFWQVVEDRGGWQGEIASRSLDGTVYTIWCSVSALRDERQRLTGYALVQSNLTELRLMQARAEQLAATDQLTGLPNRLVMLDRLQQLVHSAARRQSPFALLFLDLDHFKEVNDTLGHHIGDELLRTVSERLRQQVRAQDTVARLGGDEFVVLLPDADTAAALPVARKLVTAVSLPVDQPGLDRYQPQMSVGVAVYPADGDHAELLLRNADTAMYAAKAAGRNQVVAYTRAMSQAAADFLDVQKALPEAVRRGELVLHLQPKCRLSDRRVIGAEALVRWQRPDLGLIEPSAFLPAATRGGLLPLIDQWVLAQAVQLVARWHGQGWLQEGWHLSVNQTAQDLCQPEWLERLDQLLAVAATPPHHLEIELTEGQLAQPTPELMANLQGLRARGIRLSVDDFGTGYSSMAYLKSLPISVMKIDGAFVRDMLLDPNDRSLVEAMVSLGQKLGHETVAECVETEAQLDALATLGCHVGQGHLLGRAVPVDAFERLHLPCNETRPH